MHMYWAKYFPEMPCLHERAQQDMHKAKHKKRGEAIDSRWSTSHAATNHKYAHCTLSASRFGRTGDKEVHVSDQWYQMCPWSPIPPVLYQ